MKVLVLLDVAADVRIAPERDPRSGRVREDRLVREVDPAGARALDLALALTADRPNGQVTVIHLGPAENDGFLREALARGCARAIRVWDEEAGAARTAGKAAVLAAAAQAAGFDLVLAGDCGVIGAGGQLGVLWRRRICGCPASPRVGAAALSADAHRLTATRELERRFPRDGGGRTARLSSPWPRAQPAKPRRPRRSPPGRCWPPATRTSRCGPWPTWA